MFKKLLTLMLSLFSLLVLSSRPAQAQTFVCPSSDYTMCPILTAYCFPEVGQAIGECIPDPPVLPTTFTWCCPVDASGASTCCPGARDLILGCSDQGVCYPTEDSLPQMTREGTGGYEVNARCPLNYQNGTVFWCDPDMPDGTPPGEVSVQLKPVAKAEHLDASLCPRRVLSNACPTRLPAKPCVANRTRSAVWAWPMARWLVVACLLAHFALATVPTITITVTTPMGARFYLGLTSVAGDWEDFF